MDGKPLYEYARQNKPLPKPIEARNVTIYNLELTGFKTGNEHSWAGAKEELSQEEKDMMGKLETLVKQESTNSGDAGAEAAAAAVPEASTSTVESTDASSEPSAEKPVEGKYDYSWSMYTADCFYCEM